LVLKKLFGEEVNKELLIDFLNELLPKRHKIKELTYQPNEQLSITEYDRKAIFDLYCESEKGRSSLSKSKEPSRIFLRTEACIKPLFQYSNKPLVAVIGISDLLQHIP
jgi:hypothetical protein